MAYVLGIPSPKEDLDGSQIRSVYYEDRDIDRIAKSCELDVVTTAQVFLRLRNEELLAEDEIIYKCPMIYPSGASVFRCGFISL